MAEEIRIVTIKLDSCFWDCPFLNRTYITCHHPELNASRKIPAEEETPNGFPAWCPLPVESNTLPRHAG